MTRFLEEQQGADNEETDNERPVNKCTQRDGRGWRYAAAAPVGRRLCQLLRPSGFIGEQALHRKALVAPTTL